MILPVRPSRLRSSIQSWMGVGVLAAVTGTACLAQSHAPTPTGNASAGPAPGTNAPAAKASARPLWRELSARQQKALEPLAPHWNALTEQHKRKWLAISRNYADLPESDQKVLHSRMSEWAVLSVQERAQARHNFAEVKRLPADERKAKWEAYQALSDQQKKELAANASSNARVPGAAASVQPVPAQKMVTLPAPSEGHLPRIQLAPAPSTASSDATPRAARFMRSPTGGAPVSAEAQVPEPAGTAPGQAESTTGAGATQRSADSPSSPP